MPLISIQTSLENIPNQKIFLEELSKEVAYILKKPERYVMTILNDKLTILFNGDNTPACYIELKSVGQINGKAAKELSALICERVSNNLGLSSDRIYINMQGVSGELWGWNGSTFG